MRVLAGDIGGTSARLAIVDVDATAARVCHARRFASKAFSGIVPIVQAFLADILDVPGHSCFAIACPVIEGECTGTTLPWTIDVRGLAGEIHNVIVNPHVGLIGAALEAMREASALSCGRDVSSNK